MYLTVPVSGHLKKIKTCPATHFIGLNGIRAICALAVVISHTSISLGLTSLMPIISRLATYGVTAFFALSGFLITYLLMEEKASYGDISVKKFYMRRILRIWPLYFGYMLIAILANVYIFKFTDFSALHFYLFFFPNIPAAYQNVGMQTFIPIFLIGHFWSLGIEEQFYVFFPWMIKLLKKLFNVLVGMLLLVLLIKLIVKFISYKTGNPFWYSWADNTRFEAMAIGGLGAWLYKYRFTLVKQIVKLKVIQLLVLLVVVTVLTNLLKMPNPVSQILIAGITVLGIYYAHLLPKPFINLHNKHIDYLGKISFSIYVYHPLVIGLTGLLVQKTVLPPLFKIPLFYTTVILFTITIAALSYKYFETYFLKLKFNYAVVKSQE